MSRNTLLAAALVCIAYPMSSQTLGLTLNDVFTRIDDSNLSLAASRLNVESQRQGITAAKNDRLPDISVSLEAKYIGDGTVISRGFKDSFRDPLPHFGNSLSVSLYQPLYTGGALTTAISMARDKYSLASTDVEETRRNLRRYAAANFLTIARMNNLREVYNSNIRLTEMLIEQMRARVDQGVALANDVTRFELRLSQLKFDLRTIEDQTSIANANLAEAMSLDANVTIAPDTVGLFAEVKKLSETDWLGLATENSPSLKSAALATNLAEKALKMQRSESLPKLGLVIADNLSGPVTFEIPAINKNYNFWFVGLNLDYSLSSLYKNNHRLRQKKTDILTTQTRRNALLEQTARDIYEGCVMLEQSISMLETETQNLRLARENYDIVATRFDAQMALLTDMLDASTALLDAEVRRVNAYISIISSYYNLKFLSATI